MTNANYDVINLGNEKGGNGFETLLEQKRIVRLQIQINVVGHFKWQQKLKWVAFAKKETGIFPIIISVGTN